MVIKTATLLTPFGQSRMLESPDVVAHLHRSKTCTLTPSSPLREGAGRSAIFAFACVRRCCASAEDCYRGARS